MSQTGTPTEFLQLGITEPDDTLNVLVDLNGQWRKIDTGVKNVDTKANTNASGISALNTAVQDNTENITNILETNVNQQNSIDTLQSKVATLEEDDTSYGSRITAVEAGVQENSELINDLEVDLSGVKTNVGTVPSGSNLQGEVDGLDTRVTALENSGSVAAVEARVTTLETEVGSVPSGSTVQGQITTLNGQVNSGNIPFRFSVDGGGNYGYLKADDSFVPFSSGSPTSISGHDIITIEGANNQVVEFQSSFYVYKTTDTSSPFYMKVLYLPTNTLIDVSSLNPSVNRIDYQGIGEYLYISPHYYYYNRNTSQMVQVQNAVGMCSGKDSITYYTKGTNKYTLHYIDFKQSSRSFDETININSDNTQSTSTGKQGMIMNPYVYGESSHYYFYYTSGTNKCVWVINNGSQTTFSAVSYSTSYPFYENRRLLTSSVVRTTANSINIAFKQTTTGITIDSDDIFCNHYYKYIRVGNNVIECF